MPPTNQSNSSTSNAGLLGRMTSKSPSPISVSAILTCIRSAPNGQERSILAYRAWNRRPCHDSRWALWPASNAAISSASAAWWTCCQHCAAC